MPEITTMFWDIGGVMLSNGWDETARAKAIRTFDLGAADYESRHASENDAWERGRITLDTYLARTIFYKPRPFTENAFRDFMYAQSQDLPDGHRLADEIAQSGRYLMAALNNEAVELNVYRIRKFGLRKSFSAFFSSCFLGARKPNPEIYRMALEIAQREPAECVFIDDRAENVETARQIGIHAIQFRGAAQARRDLSEMGIVLPAMA